MRKRIVLWVLSLAVVIAAVPYGMGMIAEKEFDRVLSYLNAYSGITVHTSRYSRGWFRSEATTELEFSAETGQVSIALRHVIRHGPLVNEDGLAAALVETGVVNGSESAIPIATSILPLGSRTRFQVPQFGLALGDGKLESEGLAIMIDLHGQRVSLEMRTPKLRYTLPGGVLVLESTQLTSVLNRTEDEPWPGDINIHAGVVSYIPEPRPQTEQFAASHESEQLRIEDLRLSGHAEAEDNDSLSVQINLGIARQTFAGVTLTGASAHMDLLRLDRATLSKLGRSLQRPRPRQLVKAAEALLRRSPELKFKAEGIVDDRPFSAVLAARLDGDSAPQARVSRADARKRLSMNVSIDFSDATARAIYRKYSLHVLDEAVLYMDEGERDDVLAMDWDAITDEEYERISSNLLQKGYIVRQGESYRVEADFSRGALAINGRRVDEPVDKLF